MKKEYTTFCLSNVDGTGGSLSGYGEDDENIF